MAKVVKLHQLHKELSGIFKLILQIERDFEPHSVVYSLLQDDSDSELT